MSKYILLLVFAFVPLGAAEHDVIRRVEVTPSPNGADLITFYRNDVPQVALLRDTLGDSRTGAHRFREVWSLTYSRPSWKQRVAAAMPFFYHRAGRNEGSSKGAPHPILDISNPTSGTWGRIAEQLIQSTVLDGHGVFLRAPTRSYSGNAIDYRNMFLARAAFVTEEDAATTLLSPDLLAEDWSEVEGRLLLARRLLGGFVSDERAAHFERLQRTGSDEDCGANWDLLRQSAEENGLYLTAFRAGDTELEGTPHQAMLWLAKPDGRTQPPHFESGFLRISDPWQDARIRNWTGYTQTWTLDSEGVVVTGTSAGDGPTEGKPVEMIPLALYALDYPRVPVLLMDFRSDRAKLREITRRAADEVATGVFGMTPYGSLSWFAARNSYLWVRDRHGAAFNRSLRQASYARVRQQLLDSANAMDPGLHQLIQSKLDSLALNPFEQDTPGERAAAERQYAALLRWFNDSSSLDRSLNRARAREYFEQTHTPGERAWMKTLQVASLGLVRPRGAVTPTEIAALNRQRRLEYATRILRGAENSPAPKTEAEADLLRQAATDVSELSLPSSAGRERADHLLTNLRLAPASLPLPADGAGQ